jgi:hypothetical protein
MASEMGANTSPSKLSAPETQGNEEKFWYSYR